LSQSQVLLKLRALTEILSQLAVKSNLATNTHAAHLGITAHFGESEDKEISKLQSETDGEVVVISLVVSAVLSVVVSAVV